MHLKLLLMVAISLSHTSAFLKGKLFGGFGGGGGGGGGGYVQPVAVQPVAVQPVVRPVVVQPIVRPVVVQPGRKLFGFNPFLSYQSQTKNKALLLLSIHSL